PLLREDERAVRVARDRQERRTAPERPAPPSAAFDRVHERQVRERAREQKEAVHPPVDAVEEQHPASRDEGARGERGAAAREPSAEGRDHRHAPCGEQRRDEPERGQATARMRDDPGEAEVERRAAALAEHGVDETAERLPPDEKRKRLVLVRRPGAEPDEQEAEDAGGAGADAETER